MNGQTDGVTLGEATG